MTRSITDWFQSRGWKPFKFQRDVWRAIADGKSGLLHATTGAGKTYAVWLGALAAFAGKSKPNRPITPVPSTSRAIKTVAPPLTVLWITPMRALAADTLRALVEPLADLAPHWTVGARTGDTSSSERSAQSRRLPTALVTTPESLSLLLAREDARELLQSVQLVVADEWHELLGNKRGVQLQLAIARLSLWNTALRVWGMSATLGNLEEAMATLLPLRNDGVPGLLVRGKLDKRLVVDTLLPANAARFSWAGHLGLGMLPQVVAELESASTTLVFVNVRSQAELWYKAILDARPDWAGVLAIHHGSLDRSVRDWVEAGLKAGTLKAVVCTSSLDLGVDFLPVERVLQIGSPKGVARLLQRAGRSGHAPGRPSRITLVPTHSLEIIESAAARAAIHEGRVERRVSPQQPVDVLVQHLCTVALGGGFTPEAMYEEVRRTCAYCELPPNVWQWCLDFVARGGPSLTAYPDYRRVVPDDQGVWRLPDKRLARRHRSNIGTIVSDASMVVQVLGGARLGTMEESFLARLSAGDCFVFAGRVLEMVRIENMTAYVRRAKGGKRPTVPRWGGSRMAISSVLADSLVEQMALAEQGRFASPELKSVRPLLEVQQRWSALPTPGTLLVETLRTREGWHLFVYPFAGRHVHIGLASLFAWRAAQIERGTFSIAINEYGFELISATPRDWAGALPALMQVGTQADLLAEILVSLNHTELARRRFREIARVSGLIFQSHPGERRSSKQLQASAQLFFDVFQRYDASNLLLRQADDEVLSQELDVAQLLASLQRMAQRNVVVRHLDRPSPFAFPLMIELFRERLTNELLAERIARMVAQLEQAADARAARGAAAAAKEATDEGDAEPPSNTPRFARRAAPEEVSPQLQAAADAVRRELDFSLTADQPTGAGARRRERKPSRPLPRL